MGLRVVSDRWGITERWMVVEGRRVVCSFAHLMLFYIGQYNKNM